MYRCLALLLFASSVFLVGVNDASAAEEAKRSGEPSYSQMVERGIAFLQKSQAPDGSFSAQASPAITALVITGVLQHGRSPDDPLVAKGLKYLEQFVREDGGIYRDDSTHQNYETCLAILCFSAANRDGRYDKLLENAEKYVKGLQWDESEGIDESRMAYGGAGYGRNKRADLSNTSFLMDALKATGNGPDDEAVQKALIFVSRCHNLESEYNTSEHASK